IRSGASGRVVLDVSPANQQGHIAFLVSTPHVHHDSGSSFQTSTPADLSFAVATKMVEALGGELKTQSTRSAKLFTFTAQLVPCGNTEDPVSAQERCDLTMTQSAGTLRILLVDDSPDNQFLMKLFLRNKTCQLDLAQDGNAAV